MKERELKDFSDIGRGGQCEIRGGVDGCFRMGVNELEIGFKDIIVYQEKEQEIYFQISATKEPDIKVKKKRFWVVEICLSYYQRILKIC